jgi:drug/metabolite transporter (DMT)-like permease
MVLAQALFAGMNVCTRLGARGLPWSEVAAARFLVGALVAFTLARARGASLRITDRPNTWRRTTFGTLSALGNFYALASPRLPLGDATTLFSTSPIFVALMSRRLLGERVGRRLGLAVALAFVGVVVLVRPSFGAAAPVAAVATGAAGLHALAMIWLRKIGPGETTEAVVFHFSSVALVVFLAISIPVWRTPDGTGLLYLGATGLLGGAAQIAMTRAYALVPAARVTAIAYLGIVFTHVLAMPVFGDRPTAWQALGAALVVGAGLAITGSARRAPESGEHAIPRHTGELPVPDPMPAPASGPSPDDAPPRRATA